MDAASDQTMFAHHRLSCVSAMLACLAFPACRSSRLGPDPAPRQALEQAWRARCQRLTTDLRRAGARSITVGGPGLPDPGPQRVLLTLLEHDDELQRFVLRDGRVRRLASRPLRPLQRLVIQTRDELEHGALRPGFPRLARLLARLHRQLLEGVPLRGARELVVAPDGMSWLIPFHALVTRTGPAPRFLVEQTAVSYAACSCCSERHPDHAVVLAPRYGHDPRHLAAVPREIAAVTRRFPRRTTVHQGDDATETRLLQALADPHALVHFAGHGLADLEPGSTPTLVLADNRPPNTLARLTRRPVAAELVVLAACTTAFPARFRDDRLLWTRTSPVVGLLLSGADQVVGASWLVKDRLSAEQMDLFYRQLDRGPAQAMRHSYRELIRRLTSPHPRLWAAYALYRR